MNIDIGAKVFDDKGQEAGWVESVIVDPQDWEVTDVVVQAGLEGAPRYVVSVSLIAKAEEGEVHLRVSSERLHEMTHYVETELEVPPQGGGEMLAYNPGNIVVPIKTPFPAPYPSPAPPPPLPELAGEAGAVPFELTEGTVVETIDGEIGYVDDVLLDQYADNITAIVVKESGIGGEDITIPVEWISEADSDRVKVAATKEQAERLLGPPSGWYLPVEERRSRRTERERR